MTTNATELANWLRNVAAASYHTRCAEAADLLTQQAERIEALEAKCALLAASEEQAEAQLADMTADRDSWRDQASQRVADWDEMRVERDALKARVEATETDARRYRWSISLEDNAESIYAIVMSCGPSASNSIDIEVDAHIAAQGGKEAR
jgi:chromosome segregation ATPase